MLAAREGRGSWQQLGWAAATALMVANVILVAYGRSGYVVLAIASTFAALGLWRGRARGVALIGLIVLGFVAVQVSPMINQRFEQGMQEIQQTDSASQLTSMGIRMVMWDTTAAIVRDAPLLGHGLASYPEQYRQRIERRYSDWKGTLSEDPHNQYLFILAEAGLLGLAAFTWFLLCAVRQPVRGPFRVIGFAALVAWCATSLFSSHFHTFNEGHLIAILLGVCLAREADVHARSAASTADRTSS
jgi:O-antigen ligase